VLEKKFILIIIDALGYRIAEKYNFRPEGFPVRNRLRTVPGFSQSALTSILTGCNPDEHGLWMMYSFNRDSSPLRWLSLLPKGISSKRRWLRRLIDWKLRRIDGIRSYYSLYSVPKKVLPFVDIPAAKNTFLPGGGGECRTILDELSGREAEIFIRDYHTPEKESFSHLKNAVAGGSYNFHLLYTAGLDSALHSFGTSHPEIENRLRWYEGQLRDIAAADKEAELIVLGDHGMCDVRNSIDIITGVEELDLDIPYDYIPFYDATMARFRVFNKAAEEKITGFLSEIDGGSILDYNGKKELNIYFEDNHFGDIIYLLREGTIINPSYMGEDMIEGMHGYHPDCECMYSSMCSNVEGAESAESIVDIAGLIIPGFGSVRKGGYGTG